MIMNGETLLIWIASRKILYDLICAEKLVVREEHASNRFVENIAKNKELKKKPLIGTQGAVSPEADTDNIMMYP